MIHEPSVPPVAARVAFDDFLRTDIRVGTVKTCRPNAKARLPAYVLEIDFGPLGLKTSSAQLTENYTAADLVGRQVAAVVNFPPRRVAGVKSEVLVLAGLCPRGGTVLLAVASPVEDGSRVL